MKKITASRQLAEIAGRQLTGAHGGVRPARLTSLPIFFEPEPNPWAKKEPEPNPW